MANDAFWSGLGSGVGTGVGGLLGGFATDVLGWGRTGDRRGQAQRMGEMMQQRYGRELEWLVRDAKRAGLHPLFAAGGTPAPLQSIPGQSETGSHATDAIVRGAAQVGASAGKALARAKINRDEAEAMKFASEAKLANAKAETMGGSIFAGMSDKEIAADIAPETVKNPRKRLHMTDPTGKKWVGQAATPIQDIEDTEGEIEAGIVGAQHSYKKRVQPWIWQKLHELNMDLKRMHRSINRYIR